MKSKNVVVGMEVKLRKNLSKCKYFSEQGDVITDPDLNMYAGGDIVEVETKPDKQGDVKVRKDGFMYILVNAKHLRKIKEK